MTKKTKGGKGNWYVHQRGAASVAYPNRESAKRAAASLRNAKVSRYYLPGAGGRHSASDSPPDAGRGLWLTKLIGKLIGR